MKINFKLIKLRNNCIHVAFLIIILLEGCGYKFALKPESWNDNGVKIPFVINRSNEPGIESVFTKKIRQSFIKRGVTLKANGDNCSVLQVILFDINYSPRSFASGMEGLLTSQHEISLKYEVRLLKYDKGKKESVKKIFRIKQSYLGADKLEFTDTNRRLALVKLAEKTAEEIQFLFFNL